MPGKPQLERVHQALTSTYHEWILWERPDYGPSLTEALLRHFPDIPGESWPERLDFGGLFFNGNAVLAERELTFPARLEYYEPKFPIRDAPLIFPEMSEENILYQDGDLAVLWKPQKLPTMPAKEQRKYSLKAWAEMKFGTGIHLPSRLDVSTSGLVPISISSRMNSPLQKAFQNRKIAKTYFLASHVRASWDSIQINLPIAESPLHPVLRWINSETGQSALTVFRFRGTTETGFYLYEANPRTGRTHQIRVHAEHLGIPILGDNFYQGEKSDCLHLTCARLALWHPFLNSELTIATPFHFLPGWAKSLDASQFSSL